MRQGLGFEATCYASPVRHGHGRGTRLKKAIKLEQPAVVQVQMESKELIAKCVTSVRQIHEGNRPALKTPNTTTPRTETKEAGQENKLTGSSLIILHQTRGQ